MIPYRHYVQVNIDPLGNKTTAYFFKVTISDIIDDGMMLNGGRNSDDSWEGVDHTGNEVPAGVYFIRLETDNSTLAEKVLLLK